jgi:nucleotide-binding universal stress UspA family protein
MPSPGHKPLASLSCIVRVTDEAPDTALKQALALAATTGAHLTAHIIAATTASVYTPLWSGMTASIISEINARTKAKAEALAAFVSKTAANTGVDVDVYISEGPINPTAHTAVAAASASDLIVVDQIAAMMDLKGVILEEALFHSGRPVLVASPARQMAAAPGRLLVAWDGSNHSARAAADALALFPSVTDVDIVSITGEKDLSKALPGADFARHVERKGKDATVTVLPLGAGKVADLLEARADDTDADMIVMGGYGHSRFRQFVFGGVTLSLVEHARRALLMAY